MPAPHPACGSGTGLVSIRLVLTIAVVVLSLALGGGTRQGLWSDTVVQIAALGLVAWLLYEGLGPDLRAYRFATWMVAAIILLPLAQLLPLPPALWPLLPGRAAIVQVYRAAAIDLPWLPISLDPPATWRSILSLIPAIAIFFATTGLGWRERRSLSLVFIAAGLVSVFLGLAQLMQGPTSPLRFFAFTNVSNSVGLFANRNHYAAFLYSLVPLLAAWIVGLHRESLADRWIPVAAAVLVYAALVLGVGMAQSRAGIMLAVAAALGGLVLALTSDSASTKGGVALMGATVLLGAIVVVEFAFPGIAARLSDDIRADYRLVIADTAIAAGNAFNPFGSGLGTFVPIYQIFEAPEGLRPEYVNHAHSDWLEIWIEGGLVAVAIAAAFLVWFTRTSLLVWLAASGRGNRLDRALARAATLVVALLLVHSVVDYPLRTTALMVLIAFCCALMMPPMFEDDAPQSAARRRPVTATWGAPRSLAGLNGSRRRTDQSG